MNHDCDRPSADTCCGGGIDEHGKGVNCSCVCHQQETILIGVSQILSKTKEEWGESWSEWDQSIQDGVSSLLRLTYKPPPRL